jgi:hypothetical protein
MLSAGREFKGSKCIFFDLVAFTEKDRVVQLIPRPNGRRSPRTFPLVQFDAAARRATFGNKEHDFPITFVYELIAPITCASPSPTTKEATRRRKSTS